MYVLCKLILSFVSIIPIQSMQSTLQFVFQQVCKIMIVYYINAFYKLRTKQRIFWKKNIAVVSTRLCCNFFAIWQDITETQYLLLHFAESISKKSAEKKIFVVFFLLWLVPLLQWCFHCSYEIKNHALCKSACDNNM